MLPLLSPAAELKRSFRYSASSVTFENKLKVSNVSGVIPVGTFEATFERTRITTARSAVPLALSILECGSTSSQSALGMPVLLKPSTVMNIPQKKINKEYDTCSEHKSSSGHHAWLKENKMAIMI